MITYLKGTLIEATPLRAVIDVGGVGYEVHIPVTTAEQLPASGSTVTLFTRVVYREDSQMIYGFANRETRELFDLLTEKVSGIGPKIALSILSKMSVIALRQAIAIGDTQLLAKVPGIGRKTAERIVVELKDKDLVTAGIGSTAVPPTGSAAPGPALSSPIGDALAALIALGYKPADADALIRKAASSLGPDATTEQLVRRALGS